MPETPQHLNQAMLDAVSTTLETMAFMEVRPFEPEHDCREHTQVLCATLLVHDPVQGELCMLMPESLLRDIAAGIYAAPAEELPEQKLRDILTELLNTIAGAFLTNALPEDQTFDLGLPSLGEANCSELEPSVIRWHFRVDHEFFCISASGAAWQRLAHR